MTSSLAAKMSALPLPPSNEWALEITEALEDVLQRLEKVEDICNNLLEQNLEWIRIREANESISKLRDRMLVTPINEPPIKKRC